MLNFEAGTTTERDLESIAADAINNANDASAADCHNGRNLSVKECGAGRTEVENGPPDCEGLVAVCPMPGETSEEASQRLRYIALADNEVRRQDEGFLVKIRQTKPNEDAARRGRDAERKAHPERYTDGLYVGHAPDSIWGPTPNSSEYIPMTGRINSSISGQGNTYPFYYKATGFRAGQRDGSGRCVLPVIGNPS